MTAAVASATLRAAGPADHAFLVALYATTRADLAALPLAGEQRDALMEMQFRAQDQHYRQQHPDATVDVVEVGGVPAGRLYVDRDRRVIRLVDISLVPERRSQGIGTGLVRDLQAEAARSGRVVGLHVAIGNPAARLYERLGFVTVADLGMYRRMEWPSS